MDFIENLLGQLIEMTKPIHSSSDVKVGEIYGPVAAFLRHKVEAQVTDEIAKRLSDAMIEIRTVVDKHSPSSLGGVEPGLMELLMAFTHYELSIGLAAEQLKEMQAKKERDDALKAKTN
jgi:hypothetical protein